MELVDDIRIIFDKFFWYIFNVSIFIFASGIGNIIYMKTSQIKYADSIIKNEKYKNKCYLLIYILVNFLIFIGSISVYRATSYEIQD